MITLSLRQCLGHSVVLLVCFFVFFFLGGEGGH